MTHASLKGMCEASIPMELSLVARPLPSSVACERDAFQWTYHVAAQVEDRRDYILQQRTSMTLATCFSGICAPSVSLSLLAPALGWPADLAYLWSVEWCEQSAMELSCLPHKPRCSFGDIASVLSSDTRSLIQSFGDQPTLAQLESAILGRGDAAIELCARRRHHPEGEPCELAKVNTVVAGTPCQDFSNYGHGKLLQGPSTICLLTFLCMMRKLAPLVIIMENVEGFPFRMLSRWLPMYEVDTIVFNAKALGQCVERTRRYCILTLRTVVKLTRPLSDLVGVFGRENAAEHSYLDYLKASVGELDSELAWASLRPSSRATTRLASGDDQAFEKSLVPWEFKHLSSFRKLTQLPNKHLLTFTLSQDPTQRLQVSKETIVHTLTARMHLLWVEPLRRWITARELLQFQGMPVYDRQLRYVGASGAVCSFNRSRLHLRFPMRDRNHVTTQAGMSMHCASVGSVLLWSLCYVEAGPGQKLPPTLGVHANPTGVIDDARVDEDAESVKPGIISMVQARKRKFQSALTSDASPPSPVAGSPGAGSPGADAAVSPSKVQRSVDADFFSLLRKRQRRKTLS